MGKLTIRTGPQAGMEFSADRPSVRIGRGSGNDVVLQDSQASRHHAEVSRQGDQFYVRDLGSTNGTFVNEERITGLRLLHPGDQIRIGDTTLGYQPGVAAVAPTAGHRAAPMAAAVPSDWESDLYAASGAAPAGKKRSPWLVAGLAALIVLLLVAAAVAAVLLLRDEEGTPTVAVAQATTAATSAAVVVAPTPTSEPGVVAQPTATPLVEVPTVEVATVAVSQATVEAGVAPVATALPPAPTAQNVPPATSGQGGQAPPLSPEQLEQLPAEVTQYLGDIPPEQLPDALAAQIQSMPPEQVQQMIGALFPGVTPNMLLSVVAASFPELSQPEIQGLLQMAFPGQNIQIQPPGPIGGRLVLGIYNPAADRHDLYLMPASGGQPTMLMDWASEPDFSPDGQWVVYFSWADDHLGLRLIKTDGSNDTQLTTIREHGYPSFSPDGTRISFYHNENYILHTINRDGSNQRDIGSGEYPAWSPAGDQIAYRGCLGGGRCGLMVANADGSNPRQITTHANDAAPRWSPNGGQITFHSDRDGNWEIYVINVDGSWLRRITINPTTDIMPVWSPDGLRIAFRSDRGGQGAVWVTSGIGGGAFKMVDGGFDPDWPDLAQMDWTR